MRRSRRVRSPQSTRRSRSRRRAVGRALWRSLLRSWDEQQTSFNPLRELRFATMLDVCDALLPARFIALDLGSGPGSLTARILDRFPAARVSAVDFDPVTQRVGRGALGRRGGRLTWVDADLGSPGWSRRLPAGRYSAALSTTALHWLSQEQLTPFYRELASVLSPKGILLNGDHLPSGRGDATLARIAERVRKRRFRGASVNREWTAWREWWAAAEKVPELRAFFRERELRSAKHPHHAGTTLDTHRRALRSAGFREVTVVWQDFENRVLFARR